MTDVVQSLAEIATGYTVFEKDQVLTEAQLNAMSSYLDDQIRLTRVVQLGVGIICGLRVRLEEDGIRVSRGTGTTTDGDLCFLPADSVFDRFKPYGEAAPVYRPFRPAGEMIPAWELVAAEQDDEAAVPLGRFLDSTDRPLEQMVAVLLMESCEHDEDLCSGTDCDNRGKQAVHTLKIILIDQNTASRFREDISVPRRAAAALRPVVAARPQLSAGTDTPLTLAEAYRAACTAIQGQRLPQLDKLVRASGRLLADTFDADPTGVWRTRLEAQRAAFAGDALGFQYYYDYLKDLVETYNEFYRLLQEESTVCCPPFDAFPKHLLLGNVVPGANRQENRTGFYPSPMVSATAARWPRARFLAQRLHTLILTFRGAATPAEPLRITPSRLEDVPLEERAIPIYYDPAGPLPVHRAWNWELTRRRMETWNYSYHAAAYNAEGGAANPLGTQCGRFGFFRIEGHLGRAVTDAQAAIEAERTRRNLPFAVRAVLLDKDRLRIIVRPPRYTDLNHFHYLLRGATANHLDDLREFTDTFGKQVDQAVDKNVITSTPGIDVSAQVRGITAQKRAATTQKVQSAATRLMANDPAWERDAADAITASAELRYEMGNFAKTDFLAPVDSVVASPFLPWVTWLGDIIKVKEEAEDERLLFEKFVGEHPGLEHFGGVTRGGTFVLIYDAGGRVVADAMLPYYLESPPVTPVQPPLTRPPDFKLPWATDLGFRVSPTITRVLDDRLVNIASKLDHTAVMVDAIGKFQPVRPGGISVSPGLADEFLNLKLQEMDTKSRTVDLLRTKALEPDLTPEARKMVESQIKEAEAGVASSINEVGRYVANTGVEVTRGSEGLTVLAAATEHLSRLTDREAKTSVKEGLAAIDTADKPELRTVITNMVRRSGIG